MQDEFEYKDLPIGRYKVVTEPNPVTGEIKVITEIMGRIQEEIIRTKSDQIRNALIDLGWQPPRTEAWDCPKCGQRNSAYARKCGRCEDD